MTQGTTSPAILPKKVSCEGILNHAPPYPLPNPGGGVSFSFQFVYPLAFETVSQWGKDRHSGESGIVPGACTGIQYPLKTLGSGSRFGLPGMTTSPCLKIF